MTTIRASVHDVEFELELAVVLVVVVIFLFLYNVPSTKIPNVPFYVFCVVVFIAMFLAGLGLVDMLLVAVVLAIWKKSPATITPPLLHCS